MAKAPAAGAAPPPSPPPPGVPLDLPASHNLLLGADVPVPPLCHRCGEADAVGGLLHRLLPRHAQLFRLKLLPPQDRQSAGYFSVQVLRGAVHLEGSSGVELASGLNWFLKYFCNSSVTWRATGGLQLDEQWLSPAGLQELERCCSGGMRIERSVPLTYYLNMVTASYSMAYWEWDRWEQEIDWMALHGVNLPLAPAGCEELWARVYEELGLTRDQLDAFFPGPSFLAWGRMGNLQGYMGPLPRAYAAKQAALQARIVRRMRSFGMTPVFPAFAGFVPAALGDRFPGAKITRASNWCHFPEPYCRPCMLDPSDPLFATIGSSYIRHLRAAWGHDPKPYYAADVFNEMSPASDDPAYLSATSAAVYAAMSADEPAAVWVMQAWLFFSDQAFWREPQMRALLSAVPRGHLVLLDLFAEQHPLWARTASFYGYPFIWCMLHNFGGNLESQGRLPSIAAGLATALRSPHSTLLGVGMAPEGLEQNPLVYDFMSEMAYRARSLLLLDSSGGSGAYAEPAVAAAARRGAEVSKAAAEVTITSSMTTTATAETSVTDGSEGAGAAAATPVRNVSSAGGSARADSLSSCSLVSCSLGSGVAFAGHPAAAAAQGLDLGVWVAQFASRRYGGCSGGGMADLYVAEAWRTLLQTAYSCDERHHNTVCDVPTSRPGLCRQEIVGWGLRSQLWYPLSRLLAAWQFLLSAVAVAQPPAATGTVATSAAAASTPGSGGVSHNAGGDGGGNEPASAVAYAAAGHTSGDGGSRGSSGSSGGGGSGCGCDLASSSAYAYDVVEVGRNLMSKLSAGLWRGVVAAYLQGDAAGVERSGSALLELLDDLEALTATHPSFCLAPALAAARRHADGDDALADIYELNLRTQLTIWGTSDYSGDSEVSDYANRQWSGLIAGFYRPRWAVWLQRLRDSLASGAPYDAEAWRQQCLALTYGWIRQQSGCPPGATDAAKQHQGHGTSRDMDTVMTDAVADDAGGSHTTPAADVNEPNRHGYLGSSITSHPAQAAVLQLHGGSSGFQPAAAVEVAMRLCRKYAACILATDDVADQ